MESKFELTCEAVKGRNDAEVIRFSGDLDATNVQTVLEKVSTLFNEGKVHIVADFSISVTSIAPVWEFSCI